MFLNKDVIGYHSRIVYGKMNEQVEEIRRSGNMVLVRKETGNIWVDQEDLSEKPIYESQTDRREPEPDRKAVKAVAGGKRKNYKYGR